MSLTTQDLSRLELTDANLVEIDRKTDQIFYQRHPEFRNQPIPQGDKKSALEWHEIRRCVVLVDLLFYKRHSEMQGKPITSQQSELKAEWLRIRQEVGKCNN